MPTFEKIKNGASKALTLFTVLDADDLRHLRGTKQDPMSKYGITGFPTLVFRKAGNRAEEKKDIDFIHYDGDRKYDAIEADIRRYHRALSQK